METRPKKTVTRKTFEKSHVLNHDRVLFNVNNLYKERPVDYEEKLCAGNTCNWVDLFHAGNFHMFSIDGKNDLRWMKEAQKIGFHTKKVSGIYTEDLEDTVQKYQHLFIPGKWFVRTENVSLKQGMHGVGPYSSLKHIIESLVTTTSTHAGFGEQDDVINVYLFPWLDINSDKEFRIFVYEGEITALSSQHLYTVNPWLISLSDEELTTVINTILDYFRDNIRDKLSFLGSYVMDLVVLEDGTPYFIEPNSFGGTYASGSSLFHWTHDDYLLTHPSDTIEVRYTIPDS